VPLLAALVLAGDARYCTEFVNKMRASAGCYVSVPLAGDLEMAMQSQKEQAPAVRGLAIFAACGVG